MRHVLAVALWALCSCGTSVVTDKGLSKSCSADTDCVAVFLGDACGTCSCPNAAIAKGSQATYNRELSSAQSLCGPRPAIACTCLETMVGCSSNTCTVLAPR